MAKYLVIPSKITFQVVLKWKPYISLCWHCIISLCVISIACKFPLHFMPFLMSQIAQTLSENTDSNTQYLPKYQMMNSLCFCICLIFVLIFFLTISSEIPCKFPEFYQICSIFLCGSKRKGLPLTLKGDKSSQ